MIESVRDLVETQTLEILLEEPLPGRKPVLTANLNPKSPRT